MKNTLDSKYIYRIFSFIVEKGEKTPEGHVLNGLTAVEYQDGYIIEISDHKVTLTLGFHQSYQLDYKNQLELDDFMMKIEQISRDFKSTK
ncbi:DUF3081 family protein [Catenovulum sediminis]|uniref:DUF3081 family protein n=1 Tax=Catenovulum sediminis TaxID=1740262 RepID=A0ABV1RLA6_9ALTE|nr:DUF3081 family protein [Catenovulum sediminis]